MSEIIDRWLADIGQLEDEIAHDEQRIAARRQLLDELRETVQRYLKAIASGNPTQERPATLNVGVNAATPTSTGIAQSQSHSERAENIAEVPGELHGHSIVEASKHVLSEIGDWADYAKVADVAIAKGYRSRKSDDRHKIIRSFYELMRRHPEWFERHQEDRRKFRFRDARLPAYPISGQPTMVAESADELNFQDD